VEQATEEPPVKGVDTNVLLRHIVRDDEGQARIATDFIASRTRDDPAFVSIVVLAELVWALRKTYGYPNHQVHALIVALLESAELSFEDELELTRMFAGARRAAGEVADNLIAHCAARAGCLSTVTFDRAAAGAIPSMELLA
jgi:predicted nucleic-acid-binding protein